MKIFENNRAWRIALTVMALLVVVLSVVYTNYLVKNVAKEEQQKVNNYISAVESLNRGNGHLANLYKKYPDLNYQPDLDLHLSIMENNTIPLIIVSETGKVDSGVNFGEKKDNDKEYLAEQLKEIQLDGRQPLIVKSEVGKQYIYYKESSLIRILRYYPIVMFILVISFIAIGFLGFRSEKNAEQNRIWAGLAKETAHQLGTPISGMIAWLEHLKLIKGDDEETMEIVTELERDIDRLGYITDRFSKIGSDPELSAHNLTVLTHNIFEYMERRSPRRVKFEYPSLEEPERMVMINAPLMEWVLENLLRNALDTIGKEGLISGEFIEDLDYYYIDVSDTGKGIPDSKFNTIFKPGFTTKKRGWGLGLSLAKRIVESYHNGKIFVKESVVNKGTTFRIQLPKQ
ncbi:MAG: signal transduction histidine kinase [Maribacter sp.]